MWNSSEGFHCGDAASEDVTFTAILKKVSGNLDTFGIVSIVHCQEHYSCGGFSETCVVVQVLPPAILWGIGTAIGEVPPYLFSYHAKRCALRNMLKS